MTAWLSILVPVLVMFLALAMERVEARLRHVTIRENDVEELLRRGRPDEIRALFRQGTGRALELFRLRNRNNQAVELGDAAGTAGPVPGDDQLIGSNR